MVLGDVMLVQQRNIKKLANRLGNLFIGERRLRNYWINRSGADILESYWNDHESPNRLLANDLINDLVSDGGALLDYGSHVGTLFRTISKTIASKNLRCFAIEPNTEAFDFLREKLPAVNVMNGDDEVFVRTDFPHVQVSVSIANAVFCTMSAARARSVVKKLCLISDTLIIGDSIVNVDGKVSRMIPEPLHYQHPFMGWLSEFGFRSIKVIPTPEQSMALQAYIVAKK